MCMCLLVHTVAAFAYEIASRMQRLVFLHLVFLAVEIQSSFWETVYFLHNISKLLYKLLMPLQLSDSCSYKFFAKKLTHQIWTYQIHCITWVDVTDLNGLTSKHLYLKITKTFPYTSIKSCKNVILGWSGSTRNPFKLQTSVESDSQPILNQVITAARQQAILRKSILYSVWHTTGSAHTLFWC